MTEVKIIVAVLLVVAVCLVVFCAWAYDKIKFLREGVVTLNDFVNTHNRKIKRIETLLKIDSSEGSVTRKDDPSVGYALWGFSTQYTNPDPTSGVLDGLYEHLGIKWQDETSKPAKFVKIKTKKNK